MEEYETSSILDKDPLPKRIRNIILHQAPITREIFGFRHYEYMYSPSQLGFLCQQITNTAEVPGSILEVGCAWGATTVFLNRHIDELGLDVNYYAVDTFEGFTDDDIRTEHERGRRYSYDAAFHANSQAWFDRTMRRNEVARVTSFRGDAATFDYKKIAPFRFVLIDVDLHRPVLAALEAIYDLVSPGGTIIIDDCKQGGEWGGAYEAFIEFTKANGLDATITHGKLGLITDVGATPNGLALSDHVRAEQVKLDFPGDVGDAGLAGLAGGEVAGFLGLAGAGPVRAVADEGGGGEDLEQEGGEREIGALRGKKPRRCSSRRPGHAGS